MKNTIIQLPTPAQGAAQVSPARGEPRVVMQVERVTKTFASPSGITTALRDVSLDIRDNELFTLLGPSGCGKTTLLRMLAGFEQPGEGIVRLDGEDIGAIPPNRRPVNTMFQNYALFPHLTVSRNVAFGLEMLRWKTADIKARVAETLDLVHMAPLGNRLPSQLSGGQQQRVALARALAPRPRVLLLDEPLSALDLKLRRAMQTELKRLQRETAVSFVLVTHDQEEALALSDRIAVLNGGELLQVGTPHEIYEHPSARFVADFVGEANLISGRVLGESEDFTIAIRPERIRLSGGVKGSDRIIEGRVTSVTYRGVEFLAEISIGATHTLRARLRGGTDLPNSGDAVHACWPLDCERRLIR